MIIYNIRHRGPYEYDKYILNILQLRNEVNFLSKEFIKLKDKEINDKYSEIIKLYLQVTAKDNLNEKLLVMKDMIL